MKKKVSNVEEYISSLPDESKDFFRKVDRIFQENNLEPHIKWGIPTYTLHGKNYIGIAQFKNHASVWFTYGHLLDDPDNILVNSQEGKTKYNRVWKITDPKTFNQYDLLKSYVKEAVNKYQETENIKPTRQSKTQVDSEPTLLKEAIQKNKLQSQWKNLSVAARNNYVSFINEAKRKDTKEKRISRIIPLIKEGKPISYLY